MAKWLPSLEPKSGALYTAIVEALAADIAAGRLKPGDRLPTHRELAWKLGITISTVTRAYAEAERRGLVTGEVGRGTFVRDRIADAVGILTGGARPEDEYVEMSRNLPTVAEPTSVAIERQLSEISGIDVTSLIAYGPTAGLPAHREAGAAWISRRIVRADPARVAVVAGAQNGMMLAIAALCRPGDVVLTESLAFYGMKSIATLLGVRLVGVEIDDDGMVPEALDAACRQYAPKAVYTVPTFQSPTTSVMPFARRELVVSVCRRHGVTIVEDDIYGFLDESSVPLAALAPELSVYVTSLSKSIAGGLRLGYLHAPAPVIARVVGAMRASVNTTMPLAAELVTRMIRSGDALRSAAWHRDLAARRRRTALEILAGADAVSSPGASQLWLRLPARWTGDAFADAARARGVGVTPASTFAIGRTDLPAGVRVALCAPDSDAAVARGLTILAGLLDAERTEHVAALSA